MKFWRGGQVHTADEFAEDHGAFLRHAQVTGRIVFVKDLHVAGAGRVYDVYRFERQADGDIPLPHLFAKARQTVGAHGRHIDGAGSGIAVVPRQPVGTSALPMPIELGHLRPFNARINGYTVDGPHSGNLPAAAHS